MCGRGAKPAAASTQRSGLRALCGDGRDRRSVVPAHQRARTAAPGNRGQDFLQRFQPRNHRADLSPEARTAGGQTLGVTAHRYLQSADALRPQIHRRGHAAVFPRRLRSRAPHQPLPRDPHLGQAGSLWAFGFFFASARRRALAERRFASPRGLVRFEGGRTRRRPAGSTSLSRRISVTTHSISPTGT